MTFESPDRGSRILAPSHTADLPVGTVTFVMTDIEGSTSAWDTSPRTAKQAIERHDRIMVDQVCGTCCGWAQ